MFELDKMFNQHVIQVVLTLFHKGNQHEFNEFALNAIKRSAVSDFAIAVWDSTGTVISQLDLPIESVDDDRAAELALAAAEFLVETSLAQGDPDDVAMELLRRGIDLITII